MLDDIERRLVRVVFLESHLMQFFTDGNELHFRCIKGLPAGAVLVNGLLDIERLEYNLYFRHASFDVVQYGDKIPVLIISMESLRNPKHTS